MPHKRKRSVLDDDDEDEDFSTSSIPERKKSSKKRRVLSDEDEEYTVVKKKSRKSSRSKESVVYAEDTDFKMEDAFSSNEEDHMLDSDDERPVKKKKKTKKAKTSSSSSKKKKSSSSSSSSKKKRSTTPKKEKKEKKEKKKQPEIPVFEWWNLPEDELEQILNRGRSDDKWSTLKHNGPLMAPPYEPHGVKPFYKGAKVDLSPEEEEVLTMYAVMKGTEHYTNQTFQKNFWKSFKSVLRKKHPLRKASLKDLDLEPIYRWSVEKKAAEKARSAEEKKRIKEEKAKEVEKYMYCEIDGRKELVGNFRVEPPQLFRGRGKHPLTGTLKPRIQPEDITINIGKKEDAPAPPEGHQWADIITNKKVQWLATWKDFSGSVKYIQLSRKASFKGISDYKKFEKARALARDNLIDKIRKEYRKNWKSKDLHERQRGVAMYFIDVLALRCGNDKDTSKKADTVGCCSLKVRHLSFKGDNVVELDFLGKDSIRYQNDVEVPKEVQKNLREFVKDKDDNDKIFDKLSSSELNAFLKEKLDGLTAKVFRTYNASYTLDRELKKDEHKIKNKTIDEKVQYFNDANRTVAILCNHQKATAKNFDEQIQKVDADLDENKEFLRRLKKALKEWDEKDRLKRDWEKALEKVNTKYEKDLKKYEKLREKHKEQAKKHKLSVAVYLATKGIPEPKKPKKPKQRKLPSTLEGLKTRIKKQKEVVAKKKIQRQEKENNKTVSLGTSKTNYCDPRIAVSFCKRQDVPLNKIFTKTLLESFPWAKDAGKDFSFVEGKKKSKK